MLTKELAWFVFWSSSIQDVCLKNNPAHTHTYVSVCHMHTLTHTHKLHTLNCAQKEKSREIMWACGACSATPEKVPLSTPSNKSSARMHVVLCVCVCVPDLLDSRRKTHRIYMYNKAIEQHTYVNVLWWRPSTQPRIVMTLNNVWQAARYSGHTFT